MPVIDTSVLMAFMLNESEADAALAILGAGDLHAPDILPIEITNALVTAHRRKRIDDDELRQMLREAALIPVVLHPTLPLLPRALELVLSHQRRPYDGLFVALAEHLQMPLITADRKLAHGLTGTPAAGWVTLLGA